MIERDTDEDLEGGETERRPNGAPINKLLIDRTINEGRRKLKLLSAEPNSWTVRTFEAASTGKRFEKIVVVLPDQMSVDLMNRVQHLRTLLAPGGELDFI